MYKLLNILFFGIIKQLLPKYEVNIKFVNFREANTLGESNHPRVDNFQYSPHVKTIIV
jgi:hypothetical protein